MSSRAVCAYCMNAIGEWREEEGYVCGACLAIREAEKQAERDRYESEESETCNCCDQY